MALRVASSLLLLGGADAALTTACQTAIEALFNQNTAAGAFNAESPICTLPDASVVGTVTWIEDVDGNLFTTRADADPVCTSLTTTGVMNMCADPCQTKLDAAQAACAGQAPVTADLANLPLTAADAEQTQVWWDSWFSVMNRYNSLCSNSCLQYYCANAKRVGFEAITPACSTTTTTATDTTSVTATDTSTVTSTEVEEGATEATTQAPVAPTTPISTMAPGSLTTQAPVVTPQGSMPADLAAAQAVGNEAASSAGAALSTGLLNSYSRTQFVHPGYIVGAMGMIGAAVILFVNRRRSSSPADELESLTTAE